MEEKLNDISYQLSAIQLKTARPDYISLLESFEWTRAWFRRIEEVLLGLAYRGESDRPIIEFIRAKVRDTDVLTFNDILCEQFNAPPIINHYQIIMDCKDVGHDKRAIINNKNKAVVDYILKHSLGALEYVMSYSSLSSSDFAVNHLISNPLLINWNMFRNNSNIRAVRFCIFNGVLNERGWSGIDNDDIVDYLLLTAPNEINYSLFSSNPNNLAVQYLLENPNKIDYMSFSSNTNNKAIEHLLENPDKIYYTAFSRNPNNMAVEYLLNNPNKIEYEWFSCNINERAVEHMLNNVDKIDNFMFCLNSHDNAVKFILANKSRINMFALYYNSNDLVLDYILSSRYSINALYNNICNYNRQKLRALDQLQLFDRIHYLKLEHY